MLSRPLSLATVTLLIGCLAAGSAHAQATNLEAGKSPSQIFAGTCSACHKSPRGLLKTVGASSLPGFLRQHYTTSSDMASVLASYLVSNGATDTRYQAKQDQSKQGKDTKQEAARPLGPPDQFDRFGRRIQPASAQEAARPDTQQQAARPDADGLGSQGEGGRVGRNAKRQGRPGEAPDATNPQAATDSKPGTRQKLSKRGKPAEDVAKPDAAKSDAPKPEAAKPDAAKPEDAAKDEVAKEEPSKSDTANIDYRQAGSRQDRCRQGRGRQGGGYQAGFRSQTGNRQGRCAKGDRRQRADADAPRSGATGHAGSRNATGGIGCHRCGGDGRTKPATRCGQPGAARDDHLRSAGPSRSCRPAGASDLQIGPRPCPIAVTANA
jgi:hypothetical protein